jgi:hypothetical protein
LAAEKNRRFREQHVGRTLRVLTLGSQAGKGTLALTDNYLKVLIPGMQTAANEWKLARIAGSDQHGLVAGS